MAATKGISGLAAWLLLACAAVSTPVFAQDFNVRDGDAVSGALSRTGLTRISVLGARVEQVFSADGDCLQFEMDKKDGQAFVRYKCAEKTLDTLDLPGGGKLTRRKPGKKPTGQDGGGAAQPFAVFVTDDGGRTFTLNLSPTGSPSESLTLRPMALEKARSGKTIIQSDQSLPAEVLALVQVMAANTEDVSGYDISRDLHEPQPLWGGADFVRTATYSGDTLMGEAYTLTNHTGSQMRVVESEFQGPGVLAAVVVSPVLADNESTTVYRVREAAP